jgi:hypothetical protein
MRDKLYGCTQWRDWRQMAIDIVEAEPELPDAMLEELRLVPIEDLCLAVVRATKKSIIRRIKESR